MISKLCASLDRTFLAPHSSIISAHLARRSRLLNFLLFTTLLVFVPGIVYYVLSDNRADLARHFLSGLVCIAIVYAVNKTRFHQLAKYLSPLASLLFIIDASLAATERYEFSIATNFFSISIIIMGLIFSSSIVNAQFVLGVAATTSIGIYKALPLNSYFDLLSISTICFVVTHGALWLQRKDLEEMNSTSKRQERFRRGLDQAEDAIFFLEPSSLRLIDWNKTVENWFGYDRSELLSLSLNQLQKLRQDVSMESQFDGAMKFIRGEFCHRNGKAFPFEATLTFQQSANERFILMVARNISERVNQEQALELERARNIAGTRLASLGQMAGGIAHEINNPLAIIYGHAQQLKTLANLDRIDKERIETTSDRIKSTSMRISKIIQGLRTFARDGQNDPFVATRLKDIVMHTLDFCQARFENHRIKLVIDTIPESIFVDCREVQISQVILNLLNNSFDAIVGSPKAWVEISCKINDSFADIHVTDSGHGIESTVADKIMLPFFTTKEVGKGTGLGLSISLGIMRSHRGQLFLDKRCPNTRFIVRIPLAAESGAQAS